MAAIRVIPQQEGGLRYALDGWVKNRPVLVCIGMLGWAGIFGWVGVLGWAGILACIGILAHAEMFVCTGTLGWAGMLAFTGLTQRPHRQDSLCSILDR